MRYPEPGERRGGRVKGTPNKATAERKLRAEFGVKAAIEGGLLPLDVMLARMRDEALPAGEKPTDAQFEAAVAAAPYVHARLAATTLNAKVTTLPSPINTSNLTPEQQEIMDEVLLAIPETPPSNV